VDFAYSAVDFVGFDNYMSSYGGGGLQKRSLM